MPKVSVIIPTYNRGAIITQAIESVIKQSFGDFEAIIVDDGSTDETTEALSRISDQRIKCFHKNNGGVSSARNLGITQSRGEFIAFLDSDDIWPENYLETMLSKMQINPEYGIAYAAFEDVYPNGRKEKYYRTRTNTSNNLTFRMFFECHPAVLPSASICKREVLEGFFFDECLKSEEDLDWWLRLSARTSFLFIPDVCVTRNRHPKSLSQQAMLNLSPNMTLIWERFYLHLDGSRMLPPKAAKRRIGRLYRRLAKNHLRAGNKQPTIFFAKKAIRYRFFDLKCYKLMLRALLKSSKKDSVSNWRPPEPLHPYIEACGKKIHYSIQDK